MLTRRNLGRFGGILAALSLMFLPLASCGDAQLNALDVFKAENALGHQVLLFIALVAAILSIFAVQRQAQIALGLVGAATIGLEYISSINDPDRLVQLLAGAYLAFFGFVLVLLAGVLTLDKGSKG
ncbi:MAG: hypothetical protein KIS85_02595 [Anaerolineales bacterium]|nr:hypothetical protein [Anaerolineales bacterium]